jgi:hypothetical protein
MSWFFCPQLAFHMNGFGPWQQQQQQLCAHADVFLLLQIL